MVFALRRLLPPASGRCLAAGGLGRRAAAIMVNNKALDITDPQETLLDLCLRTGVAIPWDCREGTCNSCRVNVTMQGTASSVLACMEKPSDGMSLFLASKVCANLENPRAVADNIIQYLEYMIRAPKMAQEEANIDPLVQEHGVRFGDKLGAPSGKKLKQLMRNGEHIHLDKADVTDLEALVITRIAANRNRELRLLDLNGNPGIGDDGATSIAEGLVASDHELRSLFLTGCGVTDAGASALARALRKNDDLMILELRRNGLTDASAIELAEALEGHPTISHLYLTGNQIGDAGALALARAVANVSREGRKVRVWLTDNPDVSEDVRRCVVDMVPKHTFKI